MPSHLNVFKIIGLSERNDPTRQPINFFWKTLRFFFYRFTDEIICNSRNAKNYFKNFIKSKKINYIPNHIDLKEMYMLKINQKDTIIYEGTILDLTDPTYNIQIKRFSVYYI